MTQRLGLIVSLRTLAVFFLATHPMPSLAQAAPEGQEAALTAAPVATQPASTAPTIAETPTTAPSTAPTTVPVAPATPASPAVATTFSFADVATRAEDAATTLKKVESDLAADQITETIDQRLASLSAEMSASIEESDKQLAAAPSLDSLKTSERELIDARSQISNWTATLAGRATTLSRDDTRLAQLETPWKQALIDLRAAGDAGVEILARAESIVREISDLRARLSTRINRVRSIQARAAAQDVKVSDALASVQSAQASAVNRLLERDSDPIWTGRLSSEAQQSFAEDSRNSFSRQWTTTLAYVERHPLPIVGHLALIGLLTWAASRVYRRWGQQLESDPTAERSAAVFRLPFPAAIVTTLPLIPWLYPQAPRLLLALLGAAMLVPAILVLRRVFLQPMLPLLYSLGAFYAVGLAVSVTESLPSLSRALFLGTMLGGVLLLAWFLWRTPRLVNFSDFGTTEYWKLLQLAIRFGMSVMVASATANILGFVSLSRLLGNAVLTSAYVAIMLDACVRVGHALLAVALQVPPLTKLRVVQRNGTLLLTRVTALLGFAAGMWWGSITLDALSVRRPVVDNFKLVLNARWGVGAVDLSLGGILEFVAAVLGSFLLSRFVRFLLAEDVYPRMQLARGVPYAISTLLHYVILFFGFLIAVAALGYDMTKFTVLAGAFGVGLGFGMQNIVNNFVSGLILLFERPIQVGDVIELDPTTIGVVARIGIRASILRTGASAEIIVPNGLLIANRVTNWTLSNRQRGFAVELSVAAGVEPKVMLELLTRVARESKCVATSPAPQAYVTEFLAAGGLKFELRVWTDRFDDWVQARSDLVAAVHSALAASAIERV